MLVAIGLLLVAVASYHRNKMCLLSSRGRDKLPVRGMVTWGSGSFIYGSDGRNRIVWPSHAVSESNSVKQSELANANVYSGEKSFRRKGIQNYELN